MARQRSKQMYRHGFRSSAPAFIVWFVLLMSSAVFWSPAAGKTCPQSCTDHIQSWTEKCNWSECEACPACAEDASPESLRIHGEDHYGKLKAISEPERVAAFKELFGEWPPPAWLEKETPSYSQAMAERERQIMQLTNRQHRWDGWVSLCQARAVNNFTEKQYNIRKIPKHLHDKLMKVLHDGMATARDEGGALGVGGTAKIVRNDRVLYEIQKELAPMHSEWAGVELEPTSSYGIRIYQEGATMVDHLDVLETHVISSVLHIDDDIDEDFPLEVQDAHGVYKPASLKPGEMVFYESAKCFHRRAKPMKGRFHANVFLHYRPKAWASTGLARDKVRLMVPPHWLDAVKTQVKFTNSHEAHGPAILYWQRADDTLVEMSHIPVGHSEEFNTDIGHRWVVRPPEEEYDLGQWTMIEGYNDISIPWPSRDTEL